MSNERQAIKPAKLPITHNPIPITMHITLAIVTSLNGKSTKGSVSSESWASDEDQTHFFNLIQKHNLIVMGKNTYLQAKEKIKPSPDKLRIVLTREPEQFTGEQIPNQLEFSSESPKELVQRLENQGYRELLLVSGATLNSLFFKEKLINELLLTLEPKIFGTGKELVDETELDIELELESVEKLNPQGTLLLKYKVR